MTYLQRVNLSTGRQDRVPRDAAPPETRAALRPWLTAALAAADRHPLPAPAPDGFSAHARTAPGGLLVTVYGPHDPALALGLPVSPLAPDVVALVTFGAARRSLGAAKLWSQLADTARLEGGRPPPGPVAVPWVALALHPGAAAWLPEFAADVAWIFIDGEG